MMEFLVSRTSTWDGKPCEEAYRKPFTHVDQRNTDDPHKLPGILGDTWYEEGRNHRIVDGYITRDFDTEGWFVEIADLDALIAFYAKYGSLVLTPHYKNQYIPEIEIYDGYRE